MQLGAEGSRLCRKEDNNNKKKNKSGNPFSKNAAAVIVGQGLGTLLCLDGWRGV